MEKIDAEEQSWRLGLRAIRLGKRVLIRRRELWRTDEVSGLTR
jgi:hypothetical protein